MKNSPRVKTFHLLWNNTQALTISRTEQSLDGLRTWITNYPNTDVETTTKSVTSYTDAGNWNELVIDPDGTSARSFYRGGRLDHVVYVDRRARELFRQTFGYDAYNRTVSVNDTRVSGSSSQTYVSNLVSLPKTTTDTASQVTAFE